MSYGDFEGLRLEQIEGDAVADDIATTDDESTETAQTDDESGKQDTQIQSVDGTGDIQAIEPKPAKVPYTPEEFEQLLASDGKVDFERLTPEGKAIWKSVDRGLKPKLEQRAELARTKEELQKQLGETQNRIAYLEQMSRQAVPQKEPTIQDYFRNNPRGTLAYIDEVIKVTPGPQDQVKLLALRSSLLEQMSLDAIDYQRQRESMHQMATAVQQAVPDYSNELRDELTSYAQKTWGYTKPELDAMTDPRLGITAVRNLKIVYDSYKSAQQMTQAVRETKKKTPNRVEAAGEGEFTPPREEEWGSDDYVQSRNKSLIM